MRKTFVSFALALALAAPLHAQTIVADTPQGAVVHEGNELTVSSKYDDPEKLRLSQPITSHGGGGGVISFNLHKALGEVVWGGQQTEMAMLRVEQASDVRGSDNPKAEFNFLCNDGSGANDAAMKKCLSFTYDGITNISPGIANSLRVILGGGGSGNGTTLSPDGHYMLAMQGDGNLVVYRWDTDHWTARWSIFTGTIP